MDDNKPVKVGAESGKAISIYKRSFIKVKKVLRILGPGLVTGAAVALVYFEIKG